VEQALAVALALLPHPASFNYSGLTRPEGVQRNRRPSNRRKVRTLGSGSHRTRRSPLVFNVAEKLIVPPALLPQDSESFYHPSTEPRPSPQRCNTTENKNKSKKIQKNIPEKARKTKFI